MQSLHVLCPSHPVWHIITHAMTLLVLQAPAASAQVAASPSPCMAPTPPTRPPTPARSRPPQAWAPAAPSPAAAASCGGSTQASSWWVGWSWLGRCGGGMQASCTRQRPLSPSSDDESSCTSPLVPSASPCLPLPACSYPKHQHYSLRGTPAGCYNRLPWSLPSRPCSAAASRGPTRHTA